MIKVYEGVYGLLPICGVAKRIEYGVMVNEDCIYLDNKSDRLLGLEFEGIIIYPYLDTYTREDLLHRLNDTMLSLCEGFLDKGGY